MRNIFQIDKSSATMAAPLESNLSSSKWLLPFISYQIIFTDLDGITFVGIVCKYLNIFMRISHSTLNLFGISSYLTN